MADTRGNPSATGKTLTLFISNMDCSNEERLIRENLEGVPGVQRLSFDLPQRRLQVVHGLESDDSILTLLKGIGMRPVRVKAP